MSKNPLDGITYHNVPLKEKLELLYQLEEKLKFGKEGEGSLQFKEEVTEKKNLIPPIHCKPKYPSQKERNSMTRELTQSEINSQYLHENLDRCKTQKEFVICLLLSGGTYTNKLLFKEFKDRYATKIWPLKSPASVTTIATMMVRLETTALSQYILQKKSIPLDNDKRMTMVKTYTMTEEGLNLKPKEAFELAKKRIIVETKPKEKRTPKTIPPSCFGTKAIELPEIISTQSHIEIKGIKNIKISINKTEDGNSNITIEFD